MPRTILGIAKDDVLLDYMVKIMDGNVDKRGAEAQKVKLALQAFLAQPLTLQRKAIQAFRKKIQSVAVSTDFDMMLTNAFNVIIEEDNFDLGYEAAFREVPRDADKDFWEIGTVTNGVTFRKMQEGQRLQVDGIEGDHVLCYVDYYGGALGWTDKMIRFRKLAQMADKASMFRNSFYTNKAANHYALLAAAGAFNIVPYQGGAGDTRIQRTVLTINRGAFLLGNANKDKGYGDMANAPLLLYANPNDKEIIESAFRVTTDFLAAGQQQGTAMTDQPIRRIYTYNSQIVSRAPLLVLPGRKIQRNEAMAPTTFTDPQDILTLNYVQSVWSIYGAAVADTDQVYQLTLGA